MLWIFIIRRRAEEEQKGSCKRRVEQIISLEEKGNWAKKEN